MRRRELSIDHLATVRGDGRGAARMCCGARLRRLGAALAVSLRAPNALAGTTATTAAPTVTNEADEVLAVSGHGWGHGLGLSQWGAYGYALHGSSFTRILAHYYPGTTLGPAPAPPCGSCSPGRTRVARLDRRLACRRCGRRRVQLAPGSVRLPAVGEAPGQAVSLPLTFTSAAPIEVSGKPYRGRIVVSLDGKASGGQRRRARDLPRGCGRRPRCRRVAGRGPRGAGDRGAFLRARKAGAGTASPSTSTRTGAARSTAGSMPRRPRPAPP